MKKFILSVFMVLATVGCAFAYDCIIVNSSDYQLTVRDSSGNGIIHDIAPQSVYIVTDGFPSYGIKLVAQKSNANKFNHVYDFSNSYNYIMEDGYTVIMVLNDGIQQCNNHRHSYRLGEFEEI